MKRADVQPADWAAGFPAVEPKLARVLILGTLPSAESIRQGEYYVHPRNAFWPIMGALFGAGRELLYAARLRQLAARGVMLWDVLQAAQRPGSLDSAIHPRRRIANDLPALLARHSELELIAFNGVPAEALFRRHAAKACGSPAWPACACPRRVRRTPRAPLRRSSRPGARRWLLAECSAERTSPSAEPEPQAKGEREAYSAAPCAASERDFAIGAFNARPGAGPSPQVGWRGTRRSRTGRRSGRWRCGPSPGRKPAGRPPPRWC